MQLRAPMHPHDFLQLTAASCPAVNKQQVHMSRSRKAPGTRGQADCRGCRGCMKVLSALQPVAVVDKPDTPPFWLSITDQE